MTAPWTWSRPARYGGTLAPASLAAVLAAERRFVTDDSLATHLYEVYFEQYGVAHHLLANPTLPRAIVERVLAPDGPRDTRWADRDDLVAWTVTTHDVDPALAACLLEGTGEQTAATLLRRDLLDPSFLAEWVEGLHPTYDAYNLALAVGSLRRRGRGVPVLDERLAASPVDQRVLALLDSPPGTFASEEIAWVRELAATYVSTYGDSFVLDAATALRPDLLAEFWRHASEEVRADREPTIVDLVPSALAAALALNGDLDDAAWCEAYGSLARHALDARLEDPTAPQSPSALREALRVVCAAADPPVARLQTQRDALRGLGLYLALEREDFIDWIEDRLAPGDPRWPVLLTLARDWVGSIGDLVDTVLALD